jgi:hypothetical protein
MLRLHGEFINFVNVKAVTYYVYPLFEAMKQGTEKKVGLDERICP